MNTFQSSIKKYFNVSKQMSFLLVTAFEIQIIMVMFIKTSFNFLKELEFISEGYNQSLALINYSICGIQFLAFLMILWEIYKISGKQIINENIKFLTARFIIYYKDIFLIPAFYFSFESMKKSQNATMIIIPVINILAGAFFCYIKEKCCVSYKFRVENYFWKNGSKIVDSLLVMLMVGAICVVGAHLGGVVIGVKGVFRLANIYYFYEGPMIQKVQIFHNLYQIIMSTMVISAYFLSYNFQQNLTYTCATLLFGTIITNYVTQTFSFRIYNKMLSTPNILLMQEIVDVSLDNQQAMIQKRLNQIKVMSMIYLQKQKYDEKQSSQFGRWWQYFDRKILVHKIYCTNPLCKCSIRKSPDFDSRIFLKQLINEIKKLSTMFSKQMKIKITTIYMYIQILGQPLKAYYELMRLKSQNQSSQFCMQLHDLSVETRECFDQLFLKNRVKNQKLQLFKVIEFEQGVQQCEMQLKKIVTETIQFYTSFNYSTIKISSIKTQSNNLQSMKIKFQNNLLRVLNDYSSNVKLKVLIHIFYNYIQVYQNKEKQLKKISHQQLFKKRVLEKKEINVFSPQFGSIFIDLVEERGKIKNLTKNMCTIYGYPKQDMVNFNVNMFMPRLFGKHHAKFLHNFIEKGKFKLLKESVRSVFGKNKKKFLFPMKISLKAEYLLDNFFGSSSLLRPIETFSQFIIVDKQGKIEEMTEGIYKQIFMPAFGQQHQKVSRLQINKLIPSYNSFFQTNEQKALYYDKLVEGVMIFCEDGNYMMDKFKLIKDPMRSSKQAGMGNISSMTFFQIKTGDKSWSNSIVQSNEESEKNLNETMRQFLIDLQMFLLKGVKIAYKVTPILTAQFQAQLIEIITINQYVNQEQLYQCIFDELTSLLEIVTFQQDDLQIIKDHFAKLQVQLESKQYATPNTQTAYFPYQIDQALFSLLGLQAPRQIKKTNSMVTFEDIKSVQFENNGLYEFDNEIAQKASIYSSMNSLETDSRRQILVYAFSNSNGNKKIMNSGFSKIAYLGIVVLVGLLVTLLIESVIYMRLLSSEWISVNRIEEMRFLVQYRKCLIQVQEYEQLVNSSTELQLSSQSLRSITNQTQYLTNKFKQSIQNIYETVVKEQRFDELYTEFFQLDSSTNANKSARVSFIYLLNEILTKFTYIDQVNASFLRQYYQSISTKLTSLQQNQQQYLLQIEQQQLFTFFVINIIYLFLIVLGALSILPLYFYFKQEQKTMIQLLEYISFNQLKKSLKKLTVIQQKLGKLDSISNFQHIRNQIKISISFTSLLNNNNNNQSQQATVKISKSPRTISNISTNSTKTLTKYIFVGVIIVMFLSNLPIWTMLQLGYVSGKFKDSVEVSKMMYELEMKPGKLVNVYLMRVNGLLKGQEPVEVSAKLQQQISMNYFSLQSLLSRHKNNKLPISYRVFPLLQESLCELISSETCLADNNSINTSTVTFNYLVYLFKDKFQFLSNAINDQLGGVNEVINNWIASNNINHLINRITQIIQVSEIINNTTYQQYQQKFTTNIIQLIAIGILLIVINAIVLYILQHYTFRHFNSVLKQTQNIFSHFDLDTLLENTYLTSYFSDRIKHNK